MLKLLLVFLRRLLCAQLSAVEDESVKEEEVWRSFGWFCRAVVSNLGDVGLICGDSCGLQGNQGEEKCCGAEAGSNRTKQLKSLTCEGLK